jgi:ABC-2 type transport system ATP-binding protein
MTEFAIRTEGLTKIYTEITRGGLKRRVTVGLEDLNLEVNNGEVFAFLGPNAAGKTTTIKLLTRLHYPTRGEAWILGRSNAKRETMRQVGYLPEQPRLYDYLTGKEFLDFIGRIFGLNRQDRNKKIIHLLKMVGLQGRADESIRGYSRGMVQRLGLAQALLNDPMLLILDEPMSNLDPLGRKDFRDLILELKKQGKTIFFSSHILSDAEMVADRIGILKEGRLVSTGTMADLVGSQVTGVDITFHAGEEDIKKIQNIFKEAVVQGQEIMLTLENASIVPEFLRRIEHWGGQIISVIPHRKTLEELFMSELGR